MKKILATLGCVLLVAALALSAFAAFEGSTSVLSAGAEYGRGETVTVDVTINSNGNNVAQAAGAVQFDKNVLEFVSGVRHIDDIEQMTVDKAIRKQGDDTIAVAYLGGAALDGKVFTLTFKVKDNAAFGETELTHRMVFAGSTQISATGATIEIVCRHDFTKEDTAAKYEKAPASCTSQAEYYKSCTVCGEKGTETFFSGSKLAHDFTREDTAAKYEKAPSTCLVKAEYYKSCTVCGEKGTETFFAGEFAAHNFTKEDTDAKYEKAPATCTSQAEYYKSCTVCGEKGTETFFSGDKLAHTFNQQKTEELYIKKAAKCGQPAEYYYSCVCGAKGTEFFTFGTPGAHIYVEQNTDIQYQKSPASCTAKAVYYYSCECGANAKDEDPTRTFEFGEKEPHAFTKQDTAVTYLKDAATCTSKAVYYYSCNVCGAKGTTTFEYGEKLPHTDVEKVADIYLKSGATCQSEAVYYKSCDICGAKNENDTFKSGTKADHSFITWTKVDANTHKSICEFEGCDEPKVENHVFDLTLTVGAETHWNACVCGEKANETAHVYNKTEWKKDADAHWHECECSAKADEAKHEWDEGKVTKEPDTKEEGEKTYTCKVCAQPKVEKLDKLATPKTDDNSMIVPFAVLLILSACGVAAVLTLKKRSAI